jgi:hypothetical protein
MSMNVVGIPDREYFDKMIEIKEKCEELEIELPEQVKKFFGNYYGETKECIEAETLFQEIPYTKFSNSYQEGFEIDVDKIPSNIKTIRFYCSW